MLPWRRALRAAGLLRSAAAADPRPGTSRRTRCGPGERPVGRGVALPAGPDLRQFLRGAAAGEPRPEPGPVPGTGKGLWVCVVPQAVHAPRVPLSPARRSGLVGSAVPRGLAARPRVAVMAGAGSGALQPERRVNMACAGGCSGALGSPEGGFGLRRSPARWPHAHWCVSPCPEDGLGSGLLWHLSAVHVLGCCPRPWQSYQAGMPWGEGFWFTKWYISVITQLLLLCKPQPRPVMLE